jgi:transaldolase/glucose-6-phosphate isomerase
MSKIEELAQVGQSIWLDYIRRSFLASGEMHTLIDKGLRGVTSNPSIFEKAIAGSSDYDKDLKRLVEENRSEEEIYETLALKDITIAAGLLRGVYDTTNGSDGYVSLEVNPALANDTANTISEAIRLFEALHLPNVMIKVPATRAGIPAIKELIGAGININVTLLFSLDNYRDMTESYLEGLEKLAVDGPRADGGHTVDKVASVASFFVSRVDSAIDLELEKIGNKELQGTIAIANAKRVYVEFQRIFSGSRWERLAARGVRVQRLLWGSTGTKNPLYSDTLYVDQLIGPDTVNTLPLATLQGFMDHGTVATTLDKGVEEAERQLAKLADLGINLGDITQELQDQGVSAFAKSFESLMASISEKRVCLISGKKGQEAYLNGFHPAVETALIKLRDNKVISRIWAHDHTVWKDDPSEISNRLGWLHSPEMMVDAIPEMSALVEEVRNAQYTHALLLGMGGSSLAPEMFRHTFGVKHGYLDLEVLDSTDPGAVLKYTRELNPARTLYIVSTKSGGTIETLSFMKYFYTRAASTVGKKNTGEHFVAITDPGSSLESRGKELGFRKIFLNDPNIGGRYSALSYFGLVPAALMGVDLMTLLERAATMACNAEACNCPVSGDNAGAWLGNVIGELAKEGRDKLTLVTSPPISHFGAWVEQLIAESTGKEGKGVLPVEGEVLASPDTYARDRLFVYLRLENDSTHDEKVKRLIRAGQPVVQLNLRDVYDLGGEMFRWEMATAVAGSLLGINPFDQPNVESAKVLARQMVAAFQNKGRLPELPTTLEENGIRVHADFSAHSLKEVLDQFFAQARPGRDEYVGRSYIAIQAYVKPSAETATALQGFRTRLHTKYRMATTLGYGPRFLHSTGQLHKGDAGHGFFVQITAEMPEDAAIPDEAGYETSCISFGTLKMAQALGDRQALVDGSRHVIRFHVPEDVVGGVKELGEAVV